MSVSYVAVIFPDKKIKCVTYQKSAGLDVSELFSKVKNQALNHKLYRVTPSWIYRIPDNSIEFLPEHYMQDFEHFYLQFFPDEYPDNILRLFPTMSRPIDLHPWNVGIPNYSTISFADIYKAFSITFAVKFEQMKFMYCKVGSIEDILKEKYYVMKHNKKLKSNFHSNPIKNCKDDIFLRDDSIVEVSESTTENDKFDLNKDNLNENLDNSEISRNDEENSSNNINDRKNSNRSNSDNESLKITNKNEEEEDSMESTDKCLIDFDLPILEQADSLSTIKIKVDVVVGDKEYDRARRRIGVLNEIVESENNYFSDLNIMDSQFTETFFENLRLNKDIYSRTFKMIGSILPIHKEFRKALREVGTAPESSIGPVFTQFVPFFKVTVPHIVNFSSMSEELRELSLTNKNFFKAVTQICIKYYDGKNLESLLVTPVQRIPRYPLLLRELIKFTESNHWSLPSLKVAYESLTKLNQDIDIKTSEQKLVNATIKLQEEFGSKCKVMETGRALITQFNYLNYSFYLFNDLLLLRTKLPDGDSKFDELNLLIAKAETTTTSYLFTHKKVKIPIPISPESTKFNESFLKIKHEYIAKMGTFDGALRWKQMPEPYGVDNNVSYYNWPPDLQSPAMTAICEDLYLFGGKNKDNIASSDLWWYHKEDDEEYGSFCLLITENTPKGRYDCSMSVYEDKLIVFGGHDTNNNVFDDLLIFDIPTAVWTKLEVEGGPSPRFAHAAAFLGTQLWIFGGKSQSVYYNDLFCYDFSDNIWYNIETPTRPEPRAWHSAFWVPQGPNIDNLSFAIFGGAYKSATFGTVWMFDYDAADWVELRATGDTFPGSRYSHASAMVDNSLYIIGGKNQGGLRVEPYRLDINNPSAITWSALPQIDEPPTFYNGGYCYIDNFGLALFKEHLYMIKLVQGFSDISSPSKVISTFANEISDSESFKPRTRLSEPVFENTTKMVTVMADSITSDFRFNYEGMTPKALVNVVRSRYTPLPKQLHFPLSPPSSARGSTNPVVTDTSLNTNNKNLGGEQEAVTGEDIKKVQTDASEAYTSEAHTCDSSDNYSSRNESDSSDSYSDYSDSHIQRIEINYDNYKNISNIDENKNGDAVNNQENDVGGNNDKGSNDIKTDGNIQITNENKSITNEESSNITEENNHIKDSERFVNTIENNSNKRKEIENKENPEIKVQTDKQENQSEIVNHESINDGNQKEMVKQPGKKIIFVENQNKLPEFSQPENQENSTNEIITCKNHSSQTEKRNIATLIPLLSTSDAFYVSISQSKKLLDMTQLSDLPDPNSSNFFDHMKPSSTTTPPTTFNPNISILRHQSPPSNSPNAPKIQHPDKNHSQPSQIENHIGKWHTQWKEEAIINLGNSKLDEKYIWRDIVMIQPPSQGGNVQIQYNQQLINKDKEKDFKKFASYTKKDRKVALTEIHGDNVKKAAELEYPTTHSSIKIETFDDLANMKSEESEIKSVYDSGLSEESDIESKKKIDLDLLKKDEKQKRKEEKYKEEQEKIRRKQEEEIEKHKKKVEKKERKAAEQLEVKQRKQEKKMEEKTKKLEKKQQKLEKKMNFSTSFQQQPQMQSGDGNINVEEKKHKSGFLKMIKAPSLKLRFSKDIFFGKKNKQQKGSYNGQSADQFNDSDNGQNMSRLSQSHTIQYESTSTPQSTDHAFFEESESSTRNYSQQYYQTQQYFPDQQNCETTQHQQYTRQQEHRSQPPLHNHYHQQQQQYDHSGHGVDPHYDPQNVNEEETYQVHANASDIESISSVSESSNYQSLENNSESSNTRKKRRRSRKSNYNDEHNQFYEDRDFNEPRRKHRRHKHRNSDLDYVKNEDIDIIRQAVIKQEMKRNSNPEISISLMPAPHQSSLVDKQVTGNVKSHQRVFFPEEPTIETSNQNKVEQQINQQETNHLEEMKQEDMNKNEDHLQNKSEILHDILLSQSNSSQPLSASGNLELLSEGSSNESINILDDDDDGDIKKKHRHHHKHHHKRHHRYTDEGGSEDENLSKRRRKYSSQDEANNEDDGK
ncbi:hypothetical protein TRFO_16989 [Tritrichomonas foetus]|uniref:DH domain-containing protein n=1 Tax=Tritrichomonas foetus TaxID=1144522 RepID=A0A1J4KTF5_9EUKA|nr:hypothetical protein TRFO_16989 [Tritrichomonas foetus]|eukprot:OHT12942.1 hypothetical protein TRFO_16989 [Tritrichomonas foetus]